MFKRPDTAPDTAPRSVAKRRFTDRHTEMGTSIGPGVEIKGELTGSTNLEIHGLLDGNAKIEGLLVVREGGKFVGQVSATNVVVEGELDGTIHASHKVELRSDSRVEADIEAGSVAVAEGCTFEGRISMDGRAAPSEAVSFEEKRGGGSRSTDTAKRKKGD